MVKQNITAEELREILDYNPETGEFIWKKRDETLSPHKYISAWNLRYAETKAGTPHIEGYITIVINYRPYLAHRLAWLYVHGEFPPEQTDHINMNRADNRIANLRCATRSQNFSNRRSYKNNAHGFKGIYLHKASGLWHATVMRNRKKISLGYYKTPEEAASAYAEFVSLNDGGFART